MTPAVARRALELEARWQLHGRWSAVAVGGAGAMRSKREAFSVAQSVGSGGVGFRKNSPASAARTPASTSRTARE